MKFSCTPPILKHGGGEVTDLRIIPWNYRYNCLKWYSNGSYATKNEAKQTWMSNITHAEFQGYWDLGFGVKMLVVNGM